MEEKFKPYIPADKVLPEFTVTSVVMGVILAIVFGAANAYLGLRVGMTVSASIPAAVISMAVIRIIMRRDSVLESNMVQTIGSAGESLAAGAIFTLPVLYLWAAEGIMESPGIVEIAVIALCGGVLGVLFMGPLRNALIVKEHGVLPYPEGTACARVLLAGEDGADAGSVFAGMGIAALFKFIVDGLGIAAGAIAVPVKALKTTFSTEVYPALISVGYICGAKIASYLFAGGILGWFVLIPAIVTFGGESILYPGKESVQALYESGGASAIWSNYIRYIGAGAVAAGGIISLIKSLPIIVRTFADAVKGIKNSGMGGTLRTERSLNIKVIGAGIVIMILTLWILPQIPVSLPGAVMIVLFGFFFATVSSRMVGLVGSSNNPVSGMAIATLLIATTLLKITGQDVIAGMQGAIAIGSIICIIAAMAGDTSQDLKTGYLLGATPVKQQIGELVGAVVSALTIGGVLVVLDRAWGFGTEKIAAPQATLMKMIIEGVMGDSLPWALIFIGVFIAVAIEIIGIGSLPVAIGLYLPLELSSAIMIGGVIRLCTDKAAHESGRGILFCSGMIAGEGLAGILLAVLALMGAEKAIDISSAADTGAAGGIIILVILIVLVSLSALRGSKKEKGGV